MKSVPPATLVRNAARWCYVALLALAVSRAMAYFPLSPVGFTEQPPASTKLISEYVPLWVWGVVWFGVMLVTADGIRNPKNWKLQPLLWMCVVWSLGFFASTLLSVIGSPLGVPTAYLSGVLYLAVAGIIVAGSVLATVALELAFAIQSQSPAAEPTEAGDLSGQEDG